MGLGKNIQFSGGIYTPVSQLEWRQINVTYLTRYVALTVDRDAIVRDKLDNVVPIPKPTTTLISFTNLQGRAKVTNSESQFHPAAMKPTVTQIRKLIAYVISVGSTVCMENHVYTIDGKVRKQAQGLKR